MRIIPIQLNQLKSLLNSNKGAIEPISTFILIVILAVGTVVSSNIVSKQKISQQSFAGCPEDTQSCEEEYGAHCGQDNKGQMLCHKFGCSKDGSGGTGCSWGAGSYCETDKCEMPKPVTPTPDAGNVGVIHLDCPGGTKEVDKYGECCGCGKAKEVVVCKDASGKEGFYWGDCVHQADSCTNGCVAPGKPTPAADCPDQKNQMLKACIRVDCDGKNWMKVEKWCDGSGFSYEKAGRSTGVSCGASKKPNPGCSAPDDGVGPGTSCPGVCIPEKDCLPAHGVAKPDGGWAEEECNGGGNVCCLVDTLNCQQTYGGTCYAKCPETTGTGIAKFPNEKWEDCPGDEQVCCPPKEYGICEQAAPDSATYRGCVADVNSCPGRVVATNTGWSDCGDDMQTCCEIPKQPLKELGGSCQHGTECKNNMEASIDCIGGKCRQVFTLEDCGVPRQNDQQVYICDEEAGYTKRDGYCCSGQESCKGRCEGTASQKKTCVELCGGNGGECLTVDRGYRLENNSCVADVIEASAFNCASGTSCYCKASTPCTGIDQSNNPNCKTVCANGEATSQAQTSNVPVSATTDEFSTFSGHGEASSPAKNAKITLKDPEGKKYLVKTDKNGDYSITVPTDRIYDVTIESTGYKTLAFKWDSKMGLDYLMNFKLVKKDKAESGNFEIEEATKDRLLVGWNLISLPVKPKKPMTASGLLAEINRSGGLAVSVSRWQDGRWETYLAGLDKNDFAIEVGRAYFVENFNETQFKIEGDEITQPQTLDLKPGWNAIGLPKTSSCPTSSCSAKAVMNLIDQQSADSARIFGQFESGLWGTLAKEGQQFYGWDFIIKSNAGYFVKVNKPLQLLP